MLYDLSKFSDRNSFELKPKSENVDDLIKDNEKWIPIPEDYNEDIMFSKMYIIQTRRNNYGQLFGKVLLDKNKCII